MSKHMTLKIRQTIYSGLLAGNSFGEIARQIGRSESTVSREIRNHRVVWDKSPYGKPLNRCINRTNCYIKSICSDTCTRRCSTCGKCAKSCSMYIEEHCEKLNKPPYVCDACPNLNRCPLEKFRYDSFYVQKEYRITLSESRQGFNLSPNELNTIDSLVTPLILQGQSIHHAALVHNNSLSVSRRTIYRLVDKCALKARNIDLPRKCKLKIRKGIKPAKKIDRNCRIGRSMEDYNEYMRLHPDVNPVQMDSVVGGTGTSKVLLTMRFPGDFMPVFLRSNNTAQSVQEWIDFLYNGLGHEDFCTFFPVILTDNGSEFSDPAAIENAPDGSIRTRVFYCDPMASWQKSHVERCHELFRRILPSGSSFDSFSQDDMTLVASHVNSYARLVLGNKTPMDMLALYYGNERADKLLRLLGHVRIQPDKIVLSPALLRR